MRAAAVCFVVYCIALALGQIDIDDSVGVGRRFDGIGGLSGGGATSRLLVSYPEPQRSEILDYLFLPKFGASLHILKVEIGGDAQSTDGTEASHMHNADDENYERGYEWWLLVEAKKRNPDIITYGLPWVFPGWVGKGTGNPYKYPEVTADYITKWYVAAQHIYNVSVDYAGIWNERNYDATYVETLRQSLNAAGQQHVKLVCADRDFADVCTAMHSDSALKAAVDVVGAHYPGTNSPADCQDLGKPLWASEDYSTYADAIGGGCWARILNQNYVNGNMTATISWNLIASYYNRLPFKGDGLMWATSPWSGNYEVKSPIWVTAHTTQFAEPGWNYLKHGYGAGHLPKGGSYVSLTNGTDLTIVIEAMSHDNSVCIRPYLPPYSVSPQNVTFTLKGSFAGIRELSVWYSHVTNNEDEAVYFEQLQPVQVVNGQFTFFIEVDFVYTLSTTRGQRKGQYRDPPMPRPFPLPYKDDFNSYELYSEAAYFADQSGSWEIAEAADSSHGKVMRQMVTERPIVWCDDLQTPISLIGDYKQWAQVSVSIDVFFESTGEAFLAAHVNQGGCDQVKADNGVYFFISTTGQWWVTSDAVQKDKLASGSVTIKSNTWYTLQLDLGDTATIGHINGAQVFSIKPQISMGFVGIGSSLNYVQFDNFAVTSLLPAGTVCGVGFENWPVEDTFADVTCREPGQTIQQIDFASFGTPSGACGAFSLGLCSANNSTMVAHDLCVGRNSCKVPCSVDVFGDPCPNVSKTVAVQARCG